MNTPMGEKLWITLRPQPKSTPKDAPSKSRNEHIKSKTAPLIQPLQVEIDQLAQMKVEMTNQRTDQQVQGGDELERGDLQDFSGHQEQEDISRWEKFRQLASEESFKGVVPIS